MKKFIYYSLLIFSMCIATSCSSESPSEAAKKYAGYIANGQYEKFAEIIAYKEDATKEQIAVHKEMAILLLQETGQKIQNERKGLKSSVILSEVTSADNKNATVILNQTFGNGETENATFRMVKQDGKWKIIL